MTQTPPVWDENPIRAQRRKRQKSKYIRKSRDTDMSQPFAKRTEKRIKTDGSYPETKKIFW